MCKRMVKVLLFSLLVFGLSASVYAQPILNPINGHYYEMIDVSSSPLNWFQARDAAATRSLFGMQGHLATITSSAEQDFIINNYAGIYAFLGGHQLDNQSTPSVGWEWITGESWSYTNWDSDPTLPQPNDCCTIVEDNEQNCLEIYPTTNSSWNDAECNDAKNFYLVEYETDNCVGSVCYVPCDPYGPGCPQSHCDIYLCGTPFSIHVGQITYYSGMCMGSPPPSSCVVFIPSED